MRILGVWPGPQWSVVDVASGLFGALRRAGHEVIDYELGARIGWCKEFNRLIWEQNGRDGGLPEPTDTDALYLAGRDLPYVAARQRVDATLIITGAYVHPDALAIMQRAGMPVGIVHTEGPYEDRQLAAILPYVSVAWTNERSTVSTLRETGTPVHYLPCSYDPMRHRPDLPVPEGIPQHDVVFVGSDFRERLELLCSVDWTGIDLGLYGAWSREARDSPIGCFIRDGVISNERAAELYRAAKINLNLYRRAPGAESLNPRAVELGALGAFTISEYRREVVEVFWHLSVPVFKSARKLEYLIRRWLADDDGRKKKAAKLPAAVEDRSFDRTAAQVVSQLREVI